MSQNEARITALVITKNEELAIAKCLAGLSFCDQILVIDSGSTDNTRDLARAAGAEVVDFVWNGKYPKKKQWAMESASVRNDWVLHVDGDEIVSKELAREILSAVNSREFAAFDLPIQYHFMGKRLRHGHRVVKRSLVNRKFAFFPEVGDLAAPGITEVEGHYQPRVEGAVGRLTNELIHNDPDPVSDWIARHNKYSDWEAFLAFNPDSRVVVRGARSRGGQVFDRLPLKPVLFFLYSYVYRFGFMDGRQGLDYAMSLTWYYWTIGLKHRDPNTRSRAGRSKA